MSPWAAHIVFFPKPYGSMRVVTDFRAISYVTETEAYPMEDIYPTLDWFSLKKLLSTFDLKDGFFQVKLDDASTPLTAGRTELVFLQYTRLLPGLKKSPSTFHCIVITVLEEKKKEMSCHTSTIQVLALNLKKSIGIPSTQY